MTAMSVELIIAEFEAKSGLRVGKVLVEANGSICSLKGNPNRVVKIVNSSYASLSKKMIRLLKSLKRIKSPAVVKIHKYGAFKVGKQYCYYYVMDKLRSIGSNYWDQGDRIRGYLLDDPIPSRESSRIKSFVRKARKLNERHYYGDVHGGNIMRTKRGALKFVDLESFTH
jgi:hypothetical protein